MHYQHQAVSGACALDLCKAKSHAACAHGTCVQSGVWEGVHRLAVSHSGLPGIPHRLTVVQPVCCSLTTVPLGPLQSE